ncbi:MAG: hypothetical protein DRJ31_09100 [Candidatus Methanomethylicota archaeon]|uniref:Uncharacterized protein n=1 Tax=Thermoproteota archaeon TaxID=2056631 RepID=A0A497EL65_9CREN|nr:MAG: hypothetical protein DRJ31_09100 [Candidatus Verstraetearchaeota archaeon]
MKHYLLIPKHAVEKYRERVFSDPQRYGRDDEQIRSIIEEAFNNSIHPKRFSFNTHLLVYFTDPSSKKVLENLYYLVICPGEQDPTDPFGRVLVCKTIKYFGNLPKTLKWVEKEKNRQRRRGLELERRAEGF